VSHLIIQRHVDRNTFKVRYFAAITKYISTRQPVVFALRVHSSRCAVRCGRQVAIGRWWPSAVDSQAFFYFTEVKS